MPRSRPPPPCPRRQRHRPRPSRCRRARRPARRGDGDRRSHADARHQRHPRPDLTTEPGSVDVVICVHNALHDVRRCLMSVLARSGRERAMILVDDGSDARDRGLPRRFAARPGRRPAPQPTRRMATRSPRTSACGPRRRTTSCCSTATRSSRAAGSSGLSAAASPTTHIGIVGRSPTPRVTSRCPQLARRRRWAVNELPAG